MPVAPNLLNQFLFASQTRVAASSSQVKICLTGRIRSR